MFDVDWNDIVSAYKAYVASHIEDAVPFDEWVQDIYANIAEEGEE